MATHSSVLAWSILGTGAWRAAVYGVAQSRTRLEQLSSSSYLPGSSFSQTLKHGRILDTHTIEASPCSQHTLSLTDQRVKILGFWPQHSILP